MVKHIEANPLEDLVWITYQLTCYAVLILSLVLAGWTAVITISVTAVYVLMTY